MLLEKMINCSGNHIRGKIIFFNEEDRNAEMFLGEISVGTSKGWNNVSIYTNVKILKMFREELDEVINIMEENQDAGSKNSKM